MKEFFLILLFSEWVQLTPAPIDLLGEMLFSPEEPLTAITPGAAIHVDLSASVPLTTIRNQSTGLLELIEILERNIPLESIGGFLEELEQIELRHDVALES